MHYAFDAWMAREFPGVRFERYCDDAVVDCAREQQARHVRDAIAGRLAEVGLVVAPVNSSGVMPLSAAVREGRAAGCVPGGG